LFSCCCENTPKREIEFNTRPHPLREILVAMSFPRKPTAITQTAEQTADLIRLACVLEASARKPGNVHPGASFADVTFQDFIRSAEVVAPILAAAPSVGVGRAIRDAVSATQAAVGRNTNLGVLLLFAPLAAVDTDTPLPDGIAAVLNRLDRDDASFVYEAIRLASPGGLGRVPAEDVAGEPTQTLLEVMRLAADRDRIAAQYADHFELVLGDAVGRLGECDDFATNWNEAIIGLHVHLMARYPDTLIQRKCGPAEARTSAALATAVLDAGGPHTNLGRERLRELDVWLRADGNRRNPGTTADLVAATLFAALRDGHIAAPVAFEDA
jgi:triphosphoribosyl-dephospho-CoA synthase